MYFRNDLTPLNLVVVQKLFNLPNLYVCAILTVTLREKRKLRLFENRLLRKIVGPKWDEVTETNRLHNEV